MVSLAWIATASLVAAGTVLVAASTLLGAAFPHGAIDPLVTGDLLLALAVGASMVGGGVRSPVALAVVPTIVAIALIGIGVFEWLGPGVRI